MDRPETAETPHESETALIATTGSPVPAQYIEWYEQTTTRASELAAKSLSDNTRKAYASGWKAFVAWCEAREWVPLPADPVHVALYLTDLSETVNSRGKPYSVATIAQRLAAIDFMHKAHKFQAFDKDIGVQTLMKGLRRASSRKPRQARPLLADDIRAILAAMSYTTWPQGLAATRDAFVILCGFVGAFRRSEPVSLNHGDVEYNQATGLRLHLERSKTDQEGKGSVIALPYSADPRLCVVCAYVRWSRIVALHLGDAPRSALMEHIKGQPQWQEWRHVCKNGVPRLPDDAPLLVGISHEGVIRDGYRIVNDNGVARERDGRLSPQAFGEIIQRRAEAAGYEFGPRSLNPVSAHSLRAGFVTQARMNGADVASVMKQTRHKREETVILYDRGTPETRNAVNDLGL